MQVNLDHAHVFSSDVPNTIHFFTSMLGAEVVWDEMAAGVRNVRLALGSAFFHLYDQPPRSEQRGTVHHLGIETDDLDALVTHMKSQGYVLRNEIRDDPKFRYVMVMAPDNLLLELFQCKEPARWRLRRETV